MKEKIKNSKTAETFKSIVDQTLDKPELSVVSAESLKTPLPETNVLHLLTKLSMTILFSMNILGVAGLLLTGWRNPFAIVMALLFMHIGNSALMIRLLTKHFPISEGTFKMSSREVANWQAVTAIGCLSCNFFDQFIPVLYRAAWYRFFGTRIAKGVLVCGRILDCSLVRMEPESLLGTDAILSSHWISDQSIHIGKVTVKRGATIGTRVLSLPVSRLRRGQL